MRHHDGKAQLMRARKAAQLMSGLQGYELAYELVWRGASRTDVVARARGRAATAISAQPSSGAGENMYIRNSQFLFGPNCVKIGPNVDAISPQHDKE